MLARTLSQQSAEVLFQTVDLGFVAVVGTASGGSSTGMPFRTATIESSYKGETRDERAERTARLRKRKGLSASYL
jgi:hypothetical protein